MMHQIFNSHGNRSVRMEFMADRSIQSVPSMRHPIQMPSLTASAKKSMAKRLIKLRAVHIDEDDLLQAPDRLKWYETKFCADDMPDWNAGRFLHAEQLAPNTRNVVVECEISRERIPVRNAYKFVGQTASIRVNNGIEYTVRVSSPPFGQDLNKDPLFKVRGDLFAEEIKTVKEPSSVMAPLHLHVTSTSAPDIYNLEEDDKVEVGPFKGTGIDLKGSALMAVYRYPTVVIFASGEGIATARALIEAPTDAANLSIPFRKNVRMYYQVPNEMSLCYTSLFESWEANGVAVVTTTRSFEDAFDNDDQFAYDPLYTGAVILTGGDKEAEAAARELCKAAEISAIVADAEEQAPTIFLSSTPKNFLRWKKA